MADCWICCAKCFSSWESIQTLMSFVIIWCVILLGISGWLTQSDGGDFANLAVNGVRPYKNWKTAVCDSSPYMFLKPFSFTYTNSAGSASTMPAYCPFQLSNSTYRFTVCCAGLVTVFILCFHTPLSFVARQIFIVYALLFFAVFVLDCNAVAIGYNQCAESFFNTKLHDDITGLGLKLTCNPANYAGLCVIDILIAAQFAFLYTAWMFCNNKYVRKAPTADQKALLKPHQSAPVASPMHA